MQRGQASRTALLAATYRAAHQILDQGRIFADPLAVRILGEDTVMPIQDCREDDPSKRRMRVFIAVRTRFAEDLLAEAIASGLSQIVVLGAGLDTYAYRNTHQSIRIFEVIILQRKPGSVCGWLKLRLRCHPHSSSLRLISNAKPWPTV